MASRRPTLSLLPRLLAAASLAGTALFAPCLVPAAARAQSMFAPGARPGPASDQPAWDRLCAAIRAAEDAYLAGDLPTAEARFRATAEGAAGLADARARGDVRKFSLYRISLILRASERDDDAWALGQELIEFRRPAGIPEPQWRRLWFLVQDGEEARLRGEFVAAREHWRAAAELARPAPALREYTLKNVAWFSDRIEDWPDKLAACRELVRLRDALGDGAGAAEAAQWVGECLLKSGAEDEAAAYLRRAETYWAAHNLHRLAGLYSDLAKLYLSELTAYDRAMEYQERAMLTNAAHGDMGPGNQATSGFFNRVAILYSHTGQEERALDYWRAALRESQLADAREGEALHWQFLADSLRRLGRLAEAEEAQERSLQMFQLYGNDGFRAGAQNAMGHILFESGRIGEARERFELAREIAAGMQRTTDIRLMGVSEEPMCLMGLARCEAALGRQARAVELLARARALREARGGRRELAEVWLATGDVYRTWGRMEEALAAYRGGLKALGELPCTDELIRLRLLRASGDAAAALGRLEEADACYAEAIRRLEQARRHLLDPAQASFLFRQAGGNAYSARAALLWRSGRGGPAAARAALVMSERGRGQGIRLRVSEGTAVRAGILPARQAAELAAARRLLEGAAEAVGPREGDGPAGAALRLGEVQGRYAVVRRRLLAEYPNFRRVEDPAPLTEADLDRLARRQPDTLFLEWSVVDERSTLLFAHSARAGTRCFLLPVGRGELQRLARRWRSALTVNSIAASEPERERARTLFRALLGPAEDAGLLAPGAHARLVLVPDGPLLDIPFAALEDDRGRRLVERFPLSRAISLGALLLPDVSDEMRPAAGTADLLCAADPRLPRGPRPERAALSRRGAARPLRPLRFAAAEAGKIAALFPGARVLQGARMREADVKNEMARHRLLHFATHGVLDAGNGLRSYLVMTPARQRAGEGGPDVPEDDRLEAREIMGLPLARAEMAVLSSCASGQGQDQGGDGLLGFAWAFRAAGCPSVVASLWEIDDAATSRLMAEFYRGLRAGKRKDDALRAAMLTLKGDARTRRPFCWASFDITGDAGPLRALPAPAAGRAKKSEKESHLRR